MSSVSGYTIGGKKKKRYGGLFEILIHKFLLVQLIQKPYSWWNILKQLAEILLKLCTDIDVHIFSMSKLNYSVVKRFLGGAVKKTTDAARTLAAEATLRKRSVASLALPSSGRKEALPSTGATSSKEMEKLGRLATDIKVRTQGCHISPILSSYELDLLRRRTRSWASSGSRRTSRAPSTLRTSSSRRSWSRRTSAPSGA